jgi:hypothetical protein
MISRARRNPGLISIVGEEARVGVFLVTAAFSLKSAGDAIGSRPPEVVNS